MKNDAMTRNDRCAVGGPQFWRCVAVACCWLGGTLPAQANTPQNITPGEVARLPEYCANAQSFAKTGIPGAPSPIQQHWLALMGETFWHLHHYCWALVSANRSEAAGVAPNHRVYLLNSAIADADYVVQRAPAQFPLLPEIFYRMGQYHLTAGRPAIAVSFFDKSRQAKPDYWPPYVELAKVSASLGKRSDAIAVLEEGLKLMPEQPQLTEAMKNIKNPRSVPVATAAKKPKPAAQP